MFYSFKISANGNTDIINITDKITEFISDQNIESGSLIIFSPHSTVCLTTIEYEEGLLDDFKNTLEIAVPNKKDFMHNKKWGDGNASSHIKASLIGPSLNLIIDNHKLILGTWQQVVLIDFDLKPRTRQVFIKVIETKD